MLNKKQERELVYVVIVDNIFPIPGADNTEAAAVGGWRILVRKNQFKPGDPAIYFEIDSKVPDKEPFMFLANKHYKVKTQKYFKGTFISQGLLMHAEDFGWTIKFDTFNSIPFIMDNKGVNHFPDDESRFLTKQLGVTYADASDNQRKADAADKYKIMAQRHRKLFSHQPFRFLMKHTLGKKLLFLLFGKKKDKKSGWPIWVQKTDEERIQNMPWILADKSSWIATEKIDGTSTTFTMKRKGKKFEFYVCSRNVCFDKPDKTCFYDTNVYLEMAEKYDIENRMKDLFKDPRFSSCSYITIQGETYGKSIQNRDYSIQEHNFMAFNLISSDKGRYNTLDMKRILEKENGIPCVPIVCTDYTLPDTIEEILSYATGTSVIDGGMREGIVFRSMDGQRSFKAVSNEYLLKYHS